MDKQVFRGDIYWANLKTAYVKESIQTGLRPVVVVSNNFNNRYCTTVNVLPITSRLDKKPLPIHVEIEGCGLEKKSIVLAEQITTIPKSALGDYIGSCTPEIYAKIERAMQIQNGETFDINRALRLVEAIKAANSFVYMYRHKLPNELDFRTALIDEYKTYCRKFGINPDLFYSKHIIVYENKKIQRAYA